MKRSSAMTAVSWASSRPDSSFSLVSSVMGSAIPPGTMPGEWTLRPAIASITDWPKLRRRMPRRASSGSSPITPKTLRADGSASNPSRRSGALRWKKLRACDWMIWPRLATRRSFSAVLGMRTPMTASPVFAEASRWLTGQIPHVRAVRLGISHTGRPRQNSSKPRNSVTWKRVCATPPSSSRAIVILACPSILVTGSIMRRSPIRGLLSRIGCRRPGGAGPRRRAMRSARP